MRLIKKIGLPVVLLAVFAAGVYAQAYGTDVPDTSKLTSILEWVGGIVIFLIGHVAIKSKWASALHYVEVILGWLYNLVKTVNEKTNSK